MIPPLKFKMNIKKVFGAKLIDIDPGFYKKIIRDDYVTGHEHAIKVLQN